MKNICYALAATGTLFASAANAQDDTYVWPDQMCRAVATQCIANQQGFATPNECWDANVGDHCPDLEGEIHWTLGHPPGGSTCFPDEQTQCEYFPY